MGACGSKQPLVDTKELKSVQELCAVVKVPENAGTSEHKTGSASQVTCSPQEELFTSELSKVVVTVTKRPNMAQMWNGTGVVSLNRSAFWLFCS